MVFYFISTYYNIIWNKVLDRLYSNRKPKQCYVIVALPTSYDNIIIMYILKNENIFGLPSYTCL